MINITLKNTVDLMLSDDYKERFIAEYYQTKIRYDKLHRMIVKMEADTLNFEPKCSILTLRDQALYMGEYLHTLEIRAEIEGIDLKINPNITLDFPNSASKDPEDGSDPFDE